MSKIGKNVKALSRLEMSRLLKSQMNSVLGGYGIGVGGSIDPTDPRCCRDR